jgi:isoquinoline 1-oxidoreductase beta subunit
MTIADEMDVRLEKVNVTLADARPELIWNQLTGGSNTMHAIFTPVRVAAAIARGRLLEAAATLLGALPSELSSVGDMLMGPGGQGLSIGSLAERAAVPRTTIVRPRLKSQSQFSVVGTPQRRIDALDIVTGAKVFAMDLEIDGALPTMVCRPPTINGTALSVRNVGQIQAMPGITDVAIIPHT